VTSYASTASETNSMNSWPMPTKRFTCTNVEMSLWICISRGRVSPTCTVVSINHTCFAVFAGPISVEVPLICAYVDFSPKPSPPHSLDRPYTRPTLHSSCKHHNPHRLQGTCVNHITVRVVGHQSNNPSKFILHLIPVSISRSLRYLNSSGEASECD
jgi:hypothetical protein